MTELFDLAAALNTLYKYIHWEIQDKDFIPLSSEHYIKLPIADRSTKWYIINQFKLKNYATIMLIDEYDKQHLLSATRLICAISQSLPSSVSFRERLLYCKIFLPSCVFSNQDKSL